jgi:Transposase
VSSRVALCNQPRRHGLGPQQVFGWRARLRDAVKGSAPSSDATPAPIESKRWNHPTSMESQARVAPYIGHPGERIDSVELAGFHDRRNGGPVLGTNVMGSKFESMKQVAATIRTYFDGTVNLTRSRPTSGFIEAINGLFQATKRKTRGYTQFQAMKTMIFLISGKLSFAAFTPHAG